MDFKGSCCNYSESSHLAIMMGTRSFNRHEKASLVLTALTQGPPRPTAVAPLETDTLPSAFTRFPVHGLRITGGSLPSQASEDKLLTPGSPTPSAGTRLPPDSLL